ncbi:hypothetical protein FQR65_LT17025 [Abscondita terminalis]|nr:hypothetical protein FQR65_LT17025 [Abscondita terminalis]
MADKNLNKEQKAELKARKKLENQNKKIENQKILDELKAGYKEHATNLKDKEYIKKQKVKKVKEKYDFKAAAKQMPVKIVKEGYKKMDNQNLMDLEEELDSYQGVTGFIGSSGKGAKPLPITSEEVANMLQVEVKKETAKSSNGQILSTNTTEKKEKVLFEASFKVDDVVSINYGVFSGNEGQVKEMDYEKGTAIVNVEMFGRLTPAKVRFEHLELAYKH